MSKKTKIEFSANNPTCFSIGIFQAEANDDHGDYHLVSIELIFFAIDIHFYH